MKKMVMIIVLLMSLPGCINSKVVVEGAVATDKELAPINVYIIDASGEDIKAIEKIVEPVIEKIDEVL